jgi:hypothetical protein
MLGTCFPPVHNRPAISSKERAAVVDKPTHKSLAAARKALLAERT